MKLIEFGKRFTDEESCERYLHDLRENAQRRARDRKPLHVKPLAILQITVVAARHGMQKRNRRRLESEHLRRLGAYLSGS